MIRLVEHDAGSTFSPAPIISVDRAVWYRVTDIEFDYQGISAYYANLPYPDKPPLEDCHIHISALACVVKRGIRVVEADHPRVGHPDRGARANRPQPTHGSGVLPLGVLGAAPGPCPSAAPPLFCSHLDTL